MEGALENGARGRLGEVVEGAGLDRLHRALHPTLRRQHHYRHVRALLEDAHQRVSTAQSGEVEVQADDVRRLTRQSFQAGFAVRVDGDLIALGEEPGAHEFAEDGVVVDDHYSGAVRHSGFQGFTTEVAKELPQGARRCSEAAAGMQHSHALLSFLVLLSFHVLLSSHVILSKAKDLPRTTRAKAPTWAHIGAARGRSFGCGPAAPGLRLRMTNGSPCGLQQLFHMHTTPALK